MPMYPPLESTFITSRLDTALQLRLPEHVRSESGKEFTWEYSGYPHPILGTQMLKIRGRLVGANYLVDKDFSINETVLTDDELFATIDFVVLDLQRQLEQADYYGSMGLIAPLVEIEQEETM